MSDDTQRQQRVSERFCADDADITLRSSDNVLFKVNRRDLEMYSEGFASAEAISLPGSQQEVVPLSESSDVLDILLQFMRKQRQPSLKSVEFNVLERLTEAAEKYEVYNAMSICEVFMREAVGEHPIEVLNYACKHDYPDLVGISAWETISMDADSVLERLSENVQASWLFYHDRWMCLVLQIIRRHGPEYTGPHHSCKRFREHYMTVVNGLTEGVASLRKLEEVFPRSVSVDCDGCTRRLDEWRSYAEEETRKQREVDFLTRRRSPEPDPEREPGSD